MKMKIEVLSSHTIPGLEKKVENLLEVVPAEHLRGFNRLVFVDVVTEPRLSAMQRASLPALYHPRMGGQMAWAEVATTIISPREKFPKSLMTRLSMNANLAQVLLSLIAQHYHNTLSKGVRKNQLEIACRQYVEKHFEKWRENQGGWRARLLKPFKPYLDRLGKKLAKKYRAEMAKKPK